MVYSTRVSKFEHENIIHYILYIIYYLVYRQKNKIIKEDDQK